MVFGLQNELKKGAKAMGENDKDVSMNLAEYKGWARCPVCNVIWDTTFVLYGWYVSWSDLKHSESPPATLPQKLCPDQSNGMGT